MPRPRLSPAAGLLIVVTIWGLNVSLSKWALQEFPPLAFTALRFGMASVLLPLILMRAEPPLKLPLRSLLPLTALGVVGNTIYQLGFILGLARTTATNSALVLAAMPLVVAGLAAAIGMERLSRRSAIGLALATLGVVLVVTAKGVGFSSETFVGDILTLGAVLCWGTYTVGLRRLHLPLSTLAITTWTVVLGSPLLVVAGLPDLMTMDWSRTTWAGWGALLYSVVLSLAVAYILWNRSVRMVGPNRTAIFTTLTPLVAMSSAMLILGEEPGASQLVGAAAIIAGIVVSRSRPPAVRP